jgi:hypothetical protein
MTMADTSGAANEMTMSLTPSPPPGSTMPGMFAGIVSKSSVAIVATEIFGTVEYEYDLMGEGTRAGIST